MKNESEITRGVHVALPDSTIPIRSDNRFGPSDLNRNRRARFTDTPSVKF
jgi:hypothetical protein